MLRYIRKLRLFNTCYPFHSLTNELNSSHCSICKLCPALSDTAKVALGKFSNMFQASLYPTQSSCFPNNIREGLLIFSFILSTSNENSYPLFITYVKVNHSLFQHQTLLHFGIFHRFFYFEPQTQN